MDTEVMEHNVSTDTDHNVSTDTDTLAPRWTEIQKGESSALLKTRCTVEVQMYASLASWVTSQVYALDSDIICYLVVSIATGQLLFVSPSQ